MASGDLSRIYDAYYYAHGCGRPYQRDEGWLGFFSFAADHIVSGILGDQARRTVLDAGCAWGFLVEALRQRGVEAYGIDISEFAIQNLHPEVQPYCWTGSVCEPFPQRYDLITCIEVLEHMPQAEAERAIENFCRHSDDVLFSSTPFDYKEATHFNVQPPEYWAEHFARFGFFRDVDFDASFLTPWAVRYRRTSEPPPRLVKAYERKFFLLWKENVDLRNLSTEMRDQLAADEQKFQELNAQIAGQNQAIQKLSAQIYAQEGWGVRQAKRAVRLLRRAGGKVIRILSAKR